MNEIWFLYVARCADGSLYTGIARNVEARIALHNAGKGARYTRGRGPLKVCAVRRCVSMSEALKLELAVKKQPTSKKEELIKPRKLATFARRRAVIEAEKEAEKKARKKTRKKN
ncbi:MAG: GIY-YIG nuclease family protein [Polyangiaceae bacterium]